MLDPRDESLVTREPCEGAGSPATDVLYGNAICPVCHAIAQVEGDRIDNHTVRVI
jgi:hypothetical protein